MKYIIACACFLFCIKTIAQKVEKIEIPKGVIYKYSDYKTVEKAKELIKANLFDSTNYSLSSKILIIGPVLWNRYKEVDELNKIEGGNTTFMMGNETPKGKMTQSIADTKKVWNQLRTEVDSANYTIRKANQQELQYYWSIISFDIEEPFLIVETNGHHFLLNISKKDFTLLWLDEAPAIK